MLLPILLILCLTQIVLYVLCIYLSFWWHLRLGSYFSCCCPVQIDGSLWPFFLFYFWCLRLKTLFWMCMFLKNLRLASSISSNSSSRLPRIEYDIKNQRPTLLKGVMIEAWDDCLYGQRFWRHCLTCSCCWGWWNCIQCWSMTHATHCSQEKFMCSRLVRMCSMLEVCLT